MELILGMLQTEGYDARSMYVGTAYPKITIYKQGGTWTSDILMIGIFIPPQFPGIMVNLNVIYNGDLSDDVLCNPNFDVEPVLDIVLNAIKMRAV